MEAAPLVLHPAAAVHLVRLPDETLLLVFAQLAPNDLGRLCLVSHAMNHWLHSSNALALWQAACKLAGVAIETATCAAKAKAAYASHAATLCTDCQCPTRYVFKLTKQRLCEACERASPRRYGLATIDQLVHERSAVAELSKHHRDALFRSIPSLDLGVGGTRWFSRRDATSAAEQLLADRSRTARTDEAATASVDDGASASASPRGAHDEPRPGRLGAASAAAQKLEARLQAKQHKRSVKEANRLKRRGEPAAVALPVALPRSACVAPGSSHKPKRVSAREHRQGAALDAWEQQYQMLEAHFGPMLSGLSGLVLADDTL